MLSASVTSTANVIVNHVSSLCGEVQLVPLIGKKNSREGFISSNLKPNVKAKFFFREDRPTIVKKRYVHNYSSENIFEVNFINDRFVD